MALQPGDALSNNHYRIVRQLGRGGFGFVYLAQDLLLGEEVAIKELIPALVGDEVMLRRFLAEAKATMHLTHKRIVRTHSVFSERGNYYIVMEYMAGGSLEERLRERGPLPLGEAVRIAAEVCEGLSCAHEEGVVHCDLKPHNILFDAGPHPGTGPHAGAGGSAKVADFGIAHVSGEMLTRSWMTLAGFAAGTLPYMSPEQADGVRDDPRIDVYALGALLYRMLTGRTYLEFDPRETPRSQSDNVQRIFHQQPLPPSTHAPRVPAWLDGVVLKALAKRPGDRYASVDALRTSLLQRRRPASLPQPPTRLVLERPAPAPARRRPPDPRVRAVPAAKRRAPLPAWFWPAVGGAAALLVVLIIAIRAVLGGGDGAATGLLATLMPTSRTRQVRSKDGMEMVYVPAGEFRMGTSDEEVDAILAECDDCKRDWFADEQPQHRVYLDAFWIDQTEVTNDQYARFLNALGGNQGSCKGQDCMEIESEGHRHIRYENEQYVVESGYEDHPTIEVTWYGAQAYCEWVGGRLPTEAEWEKAARGTDGRKYPWGNSAPDCTKAQYGDCSGQTLPGGSNPAGTSPYGALDMAGNVWEWVADSYDGNYYAYSLDSNPRGPATGQYKVLRGGGWLSGWTSVRAAHRYVKDPGSGGNTVGFRCVAVGPGG